MLLIGTAEDEVVTKIKSNSDASFVLGYRVTNGIENGFLLKIDGSGNQIWEANLPDNLRSIDFDFAGDTIFVSGTTVPFNNGNSSFILILEDEGVDFSVIKFQMIEMDPLREGLRGVVAIDHPTIKYALNGHHGFNNADKSRILFLDATGNLIDQKDFTFFDSQIWDGIVDDINNTVTVYGFEALQTDQGFLINTDLNFSSISGISLLGMERIRDIIASETNQERMVLSNKKIALVDDNFQVISAYEMPGIEAHKKLEGPFFQDQSEYYFIGSNVMINDTLRSSLSKLSRSNDSLSLVWSKYVTGSAADVIHSNFTVINPDSIIIAESRIDNVNGFGGLDIMMSNVDESSCQLIDYDLTMSTSTVNSMVQNISKAVPDSLIISTLFLQDSIAYSAIDFDVCADSCSVRFTWMLNNCNEVTLRSRINGFANDSLVEYNWFSTNSDFSSNAIDTLVVFSSDQTSYHICLTAQDSICGMTYCDTIEIQIPTAPNFLNCPTNVVIDDCDFDVDFSGLTALDPCTNEEAVVICERVDGLPLDSFYIMDTTLIICTAVSSFGLESTCEFNIVYLDTIPPDCGNLNYIARLNPNGVAIFNQQRFLPNTSDDCGVVTTDIFNLTFNCSQIDSSFQQTAIIFDGQGNETTCELNITVKDRTDPMCDLPDIEVQLDSSGTASISINQFVDEITDNCDHISTSLSDSIFTCENLGDQLVQITAIDSSGNETICEFTLTVTDTIAPSCIVQDTMVVATDSLGAIVNFTSTVADNCDSTSVVYAPPSGSLFACGEHSIIAFTTDASGNQTTCNFLLTVTDCEPASTDDHTYIPVIVYPNPANDLLHIKAEYQINNVYLIDPAGRSIALNKNANDTYELSHLASGLYYLQIRFDEGIAYRSFVKR